MLIQKASKIIRQNKGETLIESLISILILSLLFTAIALTVAASLRITAAAAEKAAAAQDMANKITAGQFDDEQNDTLTFTFSYDILEFSSVTGDYEIAYTDNLEIEFDVLVFSEDNYNYRSFRPEP
ncbi:MAG: prepilin-type N-terminal cleavage/methylation domain-containing protein [Oscillospiraceae bacterium]|nr:prepilin-type N-terminal cleavage/methylation domain-containing protein [Oscillospiraceae bacterium]